MRFVVTLMVRDEVDIIVPMLEHTLAQGPDVVIVTDNGSVDGTAEILEQYADRGLVELHHDPVHRKQQGVTVTGMARRARTAHAADWVVNADADEFWRAADPELTLRDALERTPLSLRAFTVPVVNLIGPPARHGSGISRLSWQDHRREEELRDIGVHAHPTPNAVHRGEPDVVVAQGNHFVNIESNGQPEAAVALEVLHLPWRSWSQFEQKVMHAGRAYEASPDLRPSRNHHGMNDYRRALAGRLMPAYMLRQPTTAGLLEGEASGRYVRDERLARELGDLVPTAHFPDLLEQALDASLDEPFDEAFVAEQAVLGRQFLELERERDAERARADENKALANRLAGERDEARARAKARGGELPVAADARRLAGRVAKGLRRRLVAR